MGKVQPRHLKLFSIDFEGERLQLVVLEISVCRNCSW